MKINRSRHMRKFSFIYVIVVSIFALQSCSVEKFIPEDEFLYEGANVELDTSSNVDDLKEIRTELENVIRPEPNSKILGMRPGLYFHYKAQREKPGFINKFLNDKIGEEPVYLSDVETVTTQDLLINRLENRGFFYSSVNSAVNRDEEDKVASVTYNADLPAPYELENYQLDNDTLLIYQEIKKLLPESPLEPGMRFDLPLLKLERERIEASLKEKGYYNFNPGFLLFEADTNQYDQKQFDLFLRLKNEVPERGIIPYRITQVNVYPNYVVGNDSLMRDTVSYEGKNFIREEEFFKPKRLDPYILIDEGQNYSPSISRNTSRRLGSIGAYKFVNIRYDEIDSLSTDSLGVLEANIFLSPLNKRAIRAELQGVTKSNNFAGPSLAVTFSNRNLWKGGETLNITANLGYEVQIAGGDNAGLNSINLGLDADLMVPRLLFPIDIEDNWFDYSIPKTKINLGGNYLSRSQLYTLLSASSSFGYLWNANRYVTHELNPISVSYSQLSKTTEEFEQILEDNPFLRSSFEQRFIAGLTYSFTYNGMVDESNTHQFFVNSTLDIAGNTISLISGGSSGEGGEPNKFLGMPYAQYAKADVDFRYHFNFGGEQKIATRLFAGLGKAYGNSDVMPFPKLYFSGGPYSVRAFRIRSLGPGTYTSENDITFFDQTGNLRLEANIEYRFPIIQFLKGAVFADAGNVWNTEEDNALPGGHFESDFTNELGIGVGAGLRVDIQNFVIRFDLAAPMHDPSLPEGDRWTYDFGSPILNFAIGYPF
ncbi:BamA/TamA family outer membrane protein [Salegentibacter sp. F188]|uniref:BamA/TamA family outer membrane protein n=1 Tax=Autumnicola patrickiae TaxID=3075591 RepID=A0ABU3E2H6_9FLAO|nr:BamA/TamA family outer membrane protein [Salegentibacter sp. F188]MDT0690137.1 BamA/TamA family outer membrane protein [Salegentibacter sp. F188]